MPHRKIRRLVRRLDVPIGFAWAAASIGALAAPGPVAAQGIFELVEVTEGVHATVVRDGVSPSAFANSLIVLRDDHVLVVDSRHSPSQSRELIEQIRGLTDLPVRYLVNTHWHGDHVQGNQAFREAFPELRIVGHTTAAEDIASIGQRRLEDEISRLEVAISERQRWLEAGARDDGTALTEEEKTSLPGRIERTETYVEELRSVALTPPDLTVESRMDLPGAPAVQVVPAGPAHTRGDLIIWIPEIGLLAVGDLLEYGLPYLGDGFPAGWARALGEILTIDPAIYFPAHGPVLRDAELARTEAAFFNRLVEQAREAVGRGQTLEAGLEASDFSEFEPFFTRLIASGNEPERSEAYRAFVAAAFERAYEEARDSAGG